jgi:hypothetical protein
VLDASTAGKPPIVVKRKGCADKASAEARNKCYVRAGSAGLTSCIKKHSATAAGTSKLTLSFDLDKRGKVKSVGVAPAAVASSALGGCVKRVAQKIRFGAQSDNIRFSIPLKISQR